MTLLISLMCLITVGAVAAPVDGTNFFKDKTKIENPFELRDPFKSPIIKSDKPVGKAAYFSSGDGHYSNLKVNAIGRIQDIKVLGVLIGKERRAMVTAGNKDVIVLKEGMKVGNDGGELKAILPGGIIIVERMINVYGQEEYLETVIPISR